MGLGRLRLWLRRWQLLLELPGCRVWPRLLQRVFLQLLLLGPSLISCLGPHERPFFLRTTRRSAPVKEIFNKVRLNTPEPRKDESNRGLKRKHDSGGVDPVVAEVVSE